jgi:asparagine synthase (glutamine-hydrolysing)
VLGFTRLAINGLNGDGMQPFKWRARDGSVYHWICNGEIYNWRALADKYGIKTTSGSDCEVLGPLFAAMGENVVEFCKALDGVFAFVILNETSGAFYIGRDPYGVRPLYMAVRGDMGMVDWMCVGSELAAITPVCLDEKGVFKSDTKVEPVKPGTCVVYDSVYGLMSTLVYHTMPDAKSADWGVEEAAEAVRKALEAAVRKRMMTERPVAALLSGGLDSSLIAALVARELRAAGVERRLETYSIGFEGSEDLRHARMVADWIGSRHTEIVMTAEQFYAAIPEVVGVIQSCDITTVRASVGNYLVAREIRRRSEAKVIFNGDGSDEVLGGYIYFYAAPSDAAFEEETARLLRDIHAFDVLRSDRSISGNGLEPRTPFLDKEFVRVARSVPTALLRPGVDGRGEKWILRKAFEGTGLLPNAVLWRRKEAFSNGVAGAAKDWAEEIRERLARDAGFANWEMKAGMFGYLQPTSPEALWYRELFASACGPYDEFARAVTPYLWLPKWIDSGGDPSALVLRDIIRRADDLAREAIKG